MRHAKRRDLDQRDVEELLSQTPCEVSVGRRIDFLSRRFLRTPYKPNPLVGSAEIPEVFTVSLDWFDCVTYVETVLALARALTTEGFTEALRQIRYEKGSIQWSKRNHYMTHWIRNNIREGVIAPVSTRDLPTVVRQRVLNVLPGLAMRRTRVKCVPKWALPRLEPCLQTGDLIFFASTRRNLDVFHVGIIVCGETTLLRHASCSQGSVVEQRLSDFLKANRMAGMIVVRPQAVSHPLQSATKGTRPSRDGKQRNRNREPLRRDRGRIAYCK